jgi:Tol biopolymer transport system component
MSTTSFRPLLRFSVMLAIAAAPVCAQTTERVSVSTGGTLANNDCVWPQISADGRFVSFYTSASTLDAADTNGFSDVYRRDRSTGTTTRASLGNGGVQGNSSCNFYNGISGDGRYVAFASFASNLVVGDTNGVYDAFVRDMQLGTTERVSVGTGGVQGNGQSGADGIAISRDGRYVAFLSSATNLDPVVPGDTNGFKDIYVRDRVALTTERVSFGAGGVQANASAEWVSISGDGRYVAWQSVATNLVPLDTNGFRDIFLRDRTTGTTTRVSVAPGGGQANDQSSLPAISPDGRFVAFGSAATNLVAGDTNGFSDVFLRDLSAGTTERVSLSTAGTQGNLDSYQPSVSQDGRYVAFYATASNLVGGDTNGFSDVFLRDRILGTTERLSLTNGGAQGNQGGTSPTISADGRFAAFDSISTNLVGADTNGFEDCFVRDRGAASAFTAFCFGDGSVVPCPCGNNGGAGRGCENSATTSGAQLAASGAPSLSADTVVLTSSGGLPSSFGIPLQGSAAIAATNFGDGLRCAGGTLVRLFVKSAVGGVITAPQGGDPTISARSAALGDTIPIGATRIYQVYYRDPDPVFCPGPTGNTFNVSGAVAIAWGA